MQSKLKTYLRLKVYRFVITTCIAKKGLHKQTKLVSKLQSLIMTVLQNNTLRKLSQEPVFRREIVEQ